jgi:hypothetical protein
MNINFVHLYSFSDINFLISISTKIIFGMRFYTGLILVNLLELKRVAQCNYLKFTGHRQL